MKILPISPTHYNPDGSLYKTTRYWTSGTTLRYLKRLTPPEHSVSMLDELLYDVDLESEDGQRLATIAESTGSSVAAQISVV